MLGWATKYHDPVGVPEAALAITFGGLAVQRVKSFNEPPPLPPPVSTEAVPEGFRLSSCALLLVPIPLTTSLNMAVLLSPSMTVANDAGLLYWPVPRLTWGWNGPLRALRLLIADASEPVLAM